MAALELRKVHEYAKVPGTAGTYRLARTNPYMRIASGAQVLFLQSGQVFSEEQGLVKEIPSWFMDEITKASPTAIKECGGLPLAAKVKG